MWQILKIVLSIRDLHSQSHTEIWRDRQCVHWRLRMLVRCRWHWVWRLPELLEASKEGKHQMISTIYTEKSGVYSFEMTCLRDSIRRIPLDECPRSWYIWCRFIREFATATPQRCASGIGQYNNQMLAPGSRPPAEFGRDCGWDQTHGRFFWVYWSKHLHGIRIEWGIHSDTFYSQRRVELFPKPFGSQQCEFSFSGRVCLKLWTCLRSS